MHRRRCYRQHVSHGFFRRTSAVPQASAEGSYGTDTSAADAVASAKDFVRELQHMQDMQDHQRQSQEHKNAPARLPSSPSLASTGSGVRGARKEGQGRRGGVISWRVVVLVADE